MTNDHSSTSVATRCQFQFSDGRCCRMLRSPVHSSFCAFHARQELQLLESQRLGDEISASLNGDFLTATDINHVLGKLFIAVAQNRVPLRGASISTKTITDIAVKMTCGTLSHIYQQIDPLHVAEAERALQVAKAYGFRLVGRSQNLVSDPKDALEHLISHYPSHGFIIDQGEAKKIFKRVRDFTPDETTLMKYLGPLGRWPVGREDEHRVVFISTEIPARARQNIKASKGSQNHVRQKKSGPKGKSGTGTGDAAAATRTGPSVVAQIPAVQGIPKRHA